MELKVFAIYDGKGLCYGVPFFTSQIGQASRIFGDLVEDKQTTINRHPGDYVLYQIGTFDDSNGELKSLIPQLLVSQGIDFKSASYPVYQPAAGSGSGPVESSVSTEVSVS